MLTRLRLKNFKSWPDTNDVALKPVTGFFGANSSGKTSLFQSLLLLKQTVDSSDRRLVFHFGDKTTLVNLGDFQSVIHRHAKGAALELELAWREEKPFVVEDVKAQGRKIVQNDSLGFKTSVLDLNGEGAKAPKLSVSRIEYRVGKATFGMQRLDKPKQEYELLKDGANFDFVHSPGRIWPLPAPAKCYGFPDQVRAYYQNAGFLSDLELALEDRLRHVFYLGPLRAYPERQYTWAGAQPSDMGMSGDKAIDAMLASRERGETISRGKGTKRVTLEAYVAQWLKKLKLIHDFRVEPIAEGSQTFQVKVKKSAHSSEVLITDVGFGVSQILPVLVLCFYVPEGSTVILEQPEIHLHPAVQAGLADVFIDAYERRRVQVLVESHSEHLLRRLQRRIAERKFQSDDVALYFCEAGDKGSTITPLDLDLLGNITNWPADFFGDQFGELALTQEARLKQARESA